MADTQFVNAEEGIEVCKAAMTAVRLGQGCVRFTQVYFMVTEVEQMKDYFNFALVSVEKFPAYELVEKIFSDPSRVAYVMQGFCAGRSPDKRRPSAPSYRCSEEEICAVFITACWNVFNFLKEKEKNELSKFSLLHNALLKQQ